MPFSTLQMLWNHGLHANIVTVMFLEQQRQTGRRSVEYKQAKISLLTSKSTIKKELSKLDEPVCR